MPFTDALPRRHRSIYTYESRMTLAPYVLLFFFFQAEDGIRDQPRSRGLGEVYKRQDYSGI